MIRVLDPATAVVTAKTKAPLPTLYIAETLLVRGKQALGGLDERVMQVIGSLGWDYTVTKPRQPLRPRIDLKLASQPPLVLTLSPGEKPTAPVDAWVALQQIQISTPTEIAAEFELDHVLLPASLTGIGGGFMPGIGGGFMPGIGGGFMPGIGGGFMPGIGSPSEYAFPGYGGKAPVSLVVGDPARTAPQLTRPPVVVMPDTGIGPHDWFPRHETTNASQPGTQSAALGVVTVVGTPIPDDSSTVADPLTGRPARLAGHGTFIAGIIRQACPAARLESHVVMSSDGVIVESDLIALLHTLLNRQLAALATKDADQVIDVISISAGYYHESPDDTPLDTSLADVLADLGRAGALVVAGAGNDATDRPLLPAGFAVNVVPDALPLVSVGSLNPNKDTVALFSNAGTWVVTYRSGAAIVSTFPTVGNAGSQPTAEADKAAPDTHRRATIDIDDFSGGFGVWSGTSFATPVLAGELAQELVALGTEDVSLKALQERGRAALATVLGRRSKP
ncbi:MAG: S8/S53 family peptidase [Actinobacteria bacterium]|nr:S8/S53 family peptidase [Actinomycetota bacterium]